jgi:threonylcarbamoyladenosine tRNA methylthiotransferase MtaB
MVMRFDIHTLGCKVNQYDSAVVHRILSEAGLRRVTNRESPEVVVINTCTVTSSADRQGRQLLRRVRREHPHAILIVTGCQAQVMKKELLKMGLADYVVGVQEREKILEILLKELPTRGMRLKGVDEHVLRCIWRQGAGTLPGHTRGFLKVQDGCDWSCSYCIVPKARGPSRSRPLELVLEELSEMEEHGIKEVVLTGVHLGSYGKDLDPPSSLAELIERLLASSRACRFRLSSIEPLELDSPLLNVMVQGGDRVCPHLHVPIQSGDDEVLRRMNRPYTRSQLMERIGLALEYLPDATIGCDIMVGFPGETEKAFRMTRELVEKLPITYLHVFPFSPRPGTYALRYKERVPDNVIKERAKELRELSMRKRHEAMQRQLGRRLKVLFERSCHIADGWMDGISEN